MSALCRADAIRALNDLYRTAGPSAGDWTYTQGMSAQGAAFVLEAICAVQAFDAFTADNDPYGEHDFGSLVVQGRTVFWKIDYYNQRLDAGSENPADAQSTRRVMTIMLAEDY